MIKVTVTATKFKNQVGQYLEEAHRAPVAITKHGRVSSVIVDIELYRKLLHYANEARRAEIAANKKPK